MTMVVIEEIGRRHEQAERAIAAQREMLGKGPIELAWKVITGPDRVTVHADRRHPACGPNPCAPEATAQRIVADLPRTDPADHRTHQFAAGPQQTRALGRRCFEIGYAVERSQVRIDAVEFAFEPVKLMDSDVPGVDPGVRCGERDRKSTRLNSSHPSISYAVFCLKKKKREKFNVVPSSDH